MPIQVREKIKRHRVTCGGETCISASSLYAPFLLQEWKLVPTYVPLISHINGILHTYKNI